DRTLSGVAAPRRGFSTADTQCGMAHACQRKGFYLSGLLVLGGELVNVVREGTAAFDREGVVDGGAEATHRPMSLQTIHASLLRARQKCLVQFRVSQPEGNVHQRAVGF